MLYTLRFFFSSKCSLFHDANLSGSCIIHILYTGCAKIKKKKYFLPQRVNRFKFSFLSTCNWQLATCTALATHLCHLSAATSSTVSSFVSLAENQRYRQTDVHKLWLRRYGPARKEILSQLHTLTY